MMRVKILAVAATLVLGIATMALGEAAGRGGGHGYGGGYRGHGYSSYGRGFGHGRHGRGYGYGLYWYPYYGYDYGPNYGYDYGPTDEFGDVTSTTPPPVRLVPEPPSAPIVCKETVTVPTEDGGTRQIRITRC